MAGGAAGRGGWRTHRLFRARRSARPRGMPHLYLVDGSSFIFRAYHVLPKLTNKHGEPAGAVYGYTTMLWKLANELHKADGPSHLAVILDKSEHTFRNDMYDQSILEDYSAIRAADANWKQLVDRYGTLRARRFAECWLVADRRAVRCPGSSNPRPDRARHHRCPRRLPERPGGLRPAT